MNKLSPAQRRILLAASRQPKIDIREHMRDIKNPAIRDRVVESMLKHGLIIEDPDADGVAYVISDKGFAAIGKSRPKGKNAAKPAMAPVKKARADKKSGGVSKQQVIIDLLSRKEGASVLQLQNATGWQKHSVRGAVSNLQRKLKLSVSAARNAGGELVYKIA